MGTDIHGRLQWRYGPTSAKWFDGGPIENGRNYRVFAALAGVRNGFGFAGIPTHAPIQPIAVNRGIPDDAEMAGDDELVIDTSAAGVQRTAWLGDHSHSWLSLKEMLDWPGWASPLTMTGWLSPTEMLRVKEKGTPPESWCTATTESGYTRHSWTVPFRDTCPTFWAWLQYLAVKYPDPENVRIIFGFDS